MAQTELFDTDTNDTQEQILHAAFIILEKNGYDNLSIQAIANEAGLQKSSIYYHYSDKDDLLFAFLQRLIEHISTALQTHPGRTPLEQLRHLVDQSIPDREQTGQRPEIMEVETVAAIVQTRSQAVHRPAYREQITELEDTLRTELSDLIGAAVAQEGINLDGAELETVVETLTTLLIGAFERRVTVANAEPEMLRDLVHNYIDQAISSAQ